MFAGFPTYLLHVVQITSSQLGHIYIGCIVSKNMFLHFFTQFVVSASGMSTPDEALRPCGEKFEGKLGYEFRKYLGLSSI